MQKRGSLAAALAALGVKPSRTRRPRKRYAPRHSHQGSTIANQRFALNTWAVATVL